MELRFFNTYTKSVEVFTPLIPGVIKMYNCGPTVYGAQHIGNMRAAVFADMLRRVLESQEYTVTQVINITDFGHLTSDADEGDDKMMSGLKKEGLAPTLENMKIVAEKYTALYFEDLEKLGVPLQKITFPRASNYIAEQIKLIQRLQAKGFAYQTSAGVYFEVSRFPAYGKLGNINLEGQKAGIRVQENSEKRGPFDFILWKSDSKIGWESPWGLGFPGWHIECTAMIFALLGEHIDIHTGGIEHVPVHHNNEIAQAESATGDGKPFANFWLHNDHITIDNAKISKSLDNTIYLKNIEDKGIDPLALRYWFLTAHYRTPANFTWEALGASHTTLQKLRRIYQDLKEAKTNNEVNPTKQMFLKNFSDTLIDDLNTPKALGMLWEYLKHESASNAQKYEVLKFVDKILGLDLENEKYISKEHLDEGQLPDNVRKLFQERGVARTLKDFKRADELRKEINNFGYDVSDTKEGASIISKI